MVIRRKKSFWMIIVVSYGFGGDRMDIKFVVCDDDEC